MKCDVKTYFDVIVERMSEVRKGHLKIRKMKIKDRNLFNTLYSVFNRGPGLGHAYGAVKPINEITSVLQRQNIYKQTIKEL
jgi:hypothetical protein